ncbi:MAG TPA: heme o synthase [Terriglobales bacterium]|nr:heme o synthase [Terriglobales bacterium]
MSAASQALRMARGGVAGVAADYGELMKLRVTSLIVMTAWCGYYLGALKAGVSPWSWAVLHALAGIGLVAGGTGALNQVMEREGDRLMRRTDRRPLPAGRMSTWHAAAVGLAATLGGAVYLALTTNVLTGLLALATSATYLGLYTPLKKISPACTFVGAFPGAMPPLLGWAAARGRVEWEAVVLFGIVFLWQFPHFHSIAWLYREDYERAGILMRPVVDGDGRATAREILFYSLALIPVSLAPSFLHMSGTVYLAGALALGAAFLAFGVRLAAAGMPPSAPRSKAPARQLLQASVFYLPLLFALMMLNAAG